MRACAGEPISWLRLERYALGELDERDRDTVASHVEVCEACAECLDALRADADRALPLPAALAGAAVEPARRRRAWWSWGAVAAAAAAVAIAVLVTRPGPRPESGAVPARRVAVKGGELALELVRERAGSTAYEPTAFAPGDRFKLLVTCPPDDPTHADAVVYQGGEAFFPLEPAELRCGNRVAVPGAFRLTGDHPAVVCVAIARDAPPDRDALSAGPRGLRDAACLELAPTN